MLSSRQMLGLFKISEKLGIERIALVGDHKQIPAIEAGRPFALLQEKLGATELTQNIRQRDPEMRSVVEKLRAGDIRGAFEQLESRMIESSDPARSAAQDWLKLDPKARGETAIFTLYLDDKEKVIAQIERNDGKSLHALDLEVGAEKAARIEQAKVEKLDIAPPSSMSEGQHGADQSLNGKLHEQSQQNKIAANMPEKELTRDFDMGM